MPLTAPVGPSTLNGRTRPSIISLTLTIGTRNMTGRNGSPAEDPHKHRAILDQAIRTFAEVGFRGADVQVIADRAGVGKGTVYRYFGNKEDLFWATTFEVLERLDRHMLQAMEGIEGAAEKIRAACVAHGAFFEANPQHLEVFVQD